MARRIATAENAVGALRRPNESGRNQIFRKIFGAADKSGGIRLPIARRGGSRTNRIGSVLRRHLCLEIGRRGGARGAVLLTFVGSIHNPKIMLGMLVKVFCRDSIATRRCLPRESNVTFEDLMRGASDFDVRTVTVETLTSLRYLLPIAVGIVTVITTIRSAGLSCSHATFCIDVKLGRYPKRTYRNTFVSRTRCAAFLYSASSFAPAR